MRVGNRKQRRHANCTPYALTAGVWQQVQVVYTVTQPQAATLLLFQVYPNPNNGTTNLDTASLG